MLPRYPIYIPSKGRPDRVLASKMLTEDRVPHFVVVEPQDAEAYAGTVGNDKLVVLDRNDAGLDYARNFIKAHAEGFHRHWQIDDDIRKLLRNFRGKRIKVRSGACLSVIEDFVDRYENVALAGVRNQNFGARVPRPFQLNNMVFQVMLIRTDLPNRFDCPGIEDADMSLQVLADGWCTVTMNAFQFEVAAQSGRGGQTEFFDPEDRLTRAKNLQRRWPHLVRITRRNGIWQYELGHRVWGRFDTPLKFKEGVDPDAFEGPDEYGMELTRNEQR